MADSRPLHLLSLPPSTLSSLTGGGYELLEDIPTQTAQELADALNIPLEASQSVISASQLDGTTSSVPLLRSVAGLSSKKSDTGARINTRFQPLDSLLGGGLVRGNVLELSGPPGTPKERIVLGTVRSFLSEEAEILFVDCQNMISPPMLEKTFKDIPCYGSRLSYVKIYTLFDLIVFFNNLGSYLLSHPMISLLVVNSMSFPFQNATELKAFQKTALFEQIKQSLARNCATYNLTVIITSQVATKLFNADGTPGNFETGATGVLVPQLGSAYLPSGRSYKVIIGRATEQTGFLRLLSSPSMTTDDTPPIEEFAMSCVV
uniref:RecA family profile 1 domain-containing protein n=1 Tax=Moniliophthora roreri TaxID=221103 RepID=A0A0W0FNQ7_MONRR